MLIIFAFNSVILSRTSRGSSFATRGPHEALLSAVVYLPLVLPVDISRRCCSLHAHQPNASTLLSSTLSPFFFTSSSSSFLLPLLPARPACLYGHEDGPSNSAATQHLPSSITCRSHHSRTAYIFSFPVTTVTKQNINVLAQFVFILFISMFFIEATGQKRITE